MAVSFSWTPEEIYLAIDYGLEATAAETIRVAQDRCPVKTGTLQGSLRLEKPEDQHIDMGSFSVNYAEVVDKRTKFLTSATEQTWPKLPDYIKEGLR